MSIKYKNYFDYYEKEGQHLSKKECGLQAWDYGVNCNNDEWGQLQEENESLKKHGYWYNRYVDMELEMIEKNSRLQKELKLKTEAYEELHTIFTKYGDLLQEVLNIIGAGCDTGREIRPGKVRRVT